MMADRNAWDKALARYRAAKVIQDASEAWGPHHLANEAHTVAALRLRISRDSDRPASSEERERWEAIQPMLSAAESGCGDAIYYPIWIAAAELVACSSPDFDALRTKADIIKDEEVWNCGFAEKLGVDCWAILLAEAERLTGLQIKDCMDTPLPPECGAATIGMVGRT